MTGYGLPGFHHVDGAWWRVGPNDPSTIEYLADRVLPEVDQRGRPQITVTPAGGPLIVQLGARWAVDPKVLGQLSSALAPPAGSSAGPGVRLAPIASEPAHAQLILYRAGTRAVIADGTTSGFGRQTVLLNAFIQASDAGVVTAALSGRPGNLIVEVRASVYLIGMSGPVEFVAIGDIGDWCDGHRFTDFVLTGTTPAPPDPSAPSPPNHRTPSPSNPSSTTPARKAPPC